MSFTKAIKEKVGKKTDSQTTKPTINISKLISGEPIIDENSVLELDTNQVINKDQVRTQFDDDYIENLGASMIEVGQIQPIVVSPVNKDGKYEIQKGECRWRAAKLKGIKVKAIVDARSLSDTDIILGELVENIQRDNLKPLEIAVAIKVLKDGGMKQGDIAKKMAKNDSFISRHLKLLSMPDCVKKLYLDSVISDVQTLNNLTKLYKINPDRVKGLCQSVPQTGLSRKQSDNFVKEEGGVSKAIETASTESEHPKVSSVNTIQDDFAHVQNSSETVEEEFEGVQDIGVSNLSIDKPLSQQIAEQNISDEFSVSESLSSASNTGITEQILSEAVENDEDDGTLFRDGQPGMFSIEIKTQDGRIGIICLDRKDTDAEHIWVEIDSEKMRVHIDQISIVRTVG
ncbi:MAG: ParB/RepB/Spo0J family partition protein [Endozoicomonas sp. (ex Botrylloides leachii)]|nr:ParB/RepB/Spo0J family partition protein [Endozoicomonas sp. (ex Botrylloides leachii)]